MHVLTRKEAFQQFDQHEGMRLMQQDDQVIAKSYFDAGYDAAELSCHYPLAAGSWNKAEEDTLPKNDDDHLILVKSLKKNGKIKVKVSRMNPARTGFYIKYSKDGQHPLEHVIAWARLFIPTSAS